MNYTKLTHPNTKLPISIQTDASTTGIGAILQQKEQNQWKPIAFFSKGLNDAQTRYSPFDLELLAVFEAIKHFRYFFEGANNFAIYTDHKPLIGALSKKDTPYLQRQQRQLAYIAEFTNKIEHIKGTSNALPDILSRSINSITVMSDINMQELRTQQNEERTLKALQQKFPNTYKTKEINKELIICNIETNKIYVIKIMATKNIRKNIRKRPPRF